MEEKLPVKKKQKNKKKHSLEIRTNSEIQKFRKAISKKEKLSVKITGRTG